MIRSSSGYKFEMEKYSSFSCAHSRTRVHKTRARFREKDSKLFFFFLSAVRPKFPLYTSVSSNTPIINTRTWIHTDTHIHMQYGYMSTAGQRYVDVVVIVSGRIDKTEKSMKFSPPYIYIYI